MIPPEQQLTEWRQVIAWKQRLEREGPFLEETLVRPAEQAGLPRRVVDVGCGSGEHCAWFAERGWNAVGIDIKESMIESARELTGSHPSGGTTRFQQMEGAMVHELPEAPFGAAMYVGNGTAFMHEHAELVRTCSGVARALAPGAPFLIQTLNYQRIESLPLRALPVNVRPYPEDPDSDSELVFIRVLKPRPEDGFVTFFPIGLELHPSANPEEDPPEVLVRSAKQFDHRAWKREDFAAALDEAGFESVRFFGGMKGEAFDVEQSHDLVITAVRRAS